MQNDKQFDRIDRAYDRGYDRGDKGNDKKSEVSISSWMGIQFLAMIPGVNIIALIVFAVISKQRSKRNFAIAWLVWLAIVVVVLFLAIMFFGPQISGWLGEVNKSAMEVLPTNPPQF